jgi:hypothetical protein
VKTTESGGPQGFDAGKKIKGRKRRIITDTTIWSDFVVHEAGIQDRDGAPCVLASTHSRYPWLRHIFADGGYAGDNGDRIVEQSVKAAGLKTKVRVSSSRRKKKRRWRRTNQAPRFRPKALALSDCAFKIVLVVLITRFGRRHRGLGLICADGAPSATGNGCAGESTLRWPIVTCAEVSSPFERHPRRAPSSLGAAAAPACRPVRPDPGRPLNRFPLVTSSSFIESVRDSTLRSPFADLLTAFFTAVFERFFFLANRGPRSSVRLLQEPGPACGSVRPLFGL